MPNEASQQVFDSYEYKMLKSERFIFLDENNIELSKSSNSKLSKDVVLDEKLKLNLSELRNKFDNLNITYEEILDFYKKVYSKQSFYKNVMISYNVKQINLESKKDNYSKRIKLIMDKNKNINDFIKSNSKVENTFKKFLNFSKKVDDEKIFDYDHLQSQNNKDFYMKCERLINIIKSFFEFFTSR